MGTIPTTETWVDGEALTYDLMQRRLTVPLDFLRRPPRAKVRKTASYSLPNATETSIVWSIEEVDTDGMFSTAQQTRLTPKTPGWYIGNTSVSMGLTSLHPVAGDRYIYALKNGSVPIGYQRLAGPGTASRPIVYADLPLFGYFNGTTDYAEVRVYQATGAALTVFASGNTTFELRWLAT